MDAARIVGGIAVHQDVNVRIDVGEHPPHHVAFALMGLATDRGAGAAGDLDGAVGGIVVIDVDHRLGQRGPEVGNHLGDCGLLVEARQQDRHALATARLEAGSAPRYPLGFGHRSPIFAAFRPFWLMDPGCHTHCVLAAPP